jgi:hypothetical protein
VNGAGKWSMVAACMTIVPDRRTARAPRRGGTGSPPPSSRWRRAPPAAAARGRPGSAGRSWRRRYPGRPRCRGSWPSCTGT